jgi:hypothetical protein
MIYLPSIRVPQLAHYSWNDLLAIHSCPQLAHYSWNDPLIYGSPFFSISGSFLFVFEDVLISFGPSIAESQLQ